MCTSSVSTVINTCCWVSAVGEGVWLMPTPLDTPVICPILVGRASALTALEAVLRRTMAAASGSATTSNPSQAYGPTVLISGEAGIGKSRLVAETKMRAAQLHALVAQGNCFEPDRSVPYAPLHDLLCAVCAGRSSEATAQLLGPTAPELIKLVPEFAARLPGVVPVPPLEPEQEKRRLFETLTQFFLGCAADTHLLVVIEDMQWCDDTSLEFLLTLARRTARLSTPSLVLLLTYRSDEVHASLRHFLAALDRGRLATEVALNPLSIAEVEAMLRAIFEQFELQRPPRADFIEAVHSLTEGNPFFIEEVLRALMTVDAISSPTEAWQQTPVSSLHIPRSVNDAVHGRSRQLSQAARETLRLAAVAGQRFDFALLQRLTSRDERDLLQLIKELITAQLVVEESADQFAFRHALTRQAIYSELLARERKALHREIAAALEELYAASLDAHLADLAYHAYEAGAWEQALLYARRVGERSLRLYAPRAAVEHLSHALHAATQLAAVPDAALYRARGVAFEVSGAFEEARADYETALRIAGETGDHRMEWQALLDLGKLWAGRDYERTGDYVCRAYESARAMDDPTTLAYSLNRLGNWHINVDQPHEALRYHQEALAIFRHLDDAGGTAETLDLLGMASLINGDAPQGAIYAQEAIALLRTLGEHQLLSSALATLAICGPAYQSETMLTAPLSHRDAIQAGEEAIALARATGWRSGETYALTMLACCLGFHGSTSAALHVGLAALDIACEIEHQQWTAAAHWALGRIYFDVLALDAAQRHLELGLHLARSIGSPNWIGNLLGILIPTLLAQGQVDQAAQLGDEFLPPETPVQTMGQRTAWCGQAALELMRNRPKEALHIAERIATATPPSPVSPCSILVTRLHGKALAALHRADEAATMLQAARTCAETLGARGHLWRIEADLSGLYSTLGRCDDAARARAAAQLTIEELAVALPEGPLHATFLSQALALLPPQLALAMPHARRDDTGAPGGLTARERQVAILIAQGKSNRAIAEQLVVSERTVESHVTNMLGKLGFTSRAQIATWTTEMRLQR